MSEGSVSSPGHGVASPEVRDGVGQTRGTLVVEINGEAQSIADPSSVAGLLEALGLAGKRVAVAVNRNVVLRSQYGELALTGGDRIEILEAVGGG